MKKGLLFLFTILSFSLFGQYQLSNSNFENWSGTSSSEPAGWHSFNSADCTLGSLVCNLSGIVNTSQIERVSGDTRPGGSGNYCVKLKTKSTMGIVANGNITTGRIVVGSTTAASTSNHNRTDGSYNQTFTGKPDSIVFWAKFVCPSASQLFKMNAIIHEGGALVSNAIYTDPNQGNATFISREVGTALVQQPKNSAQSWQRYAAPFNYNYNGNIPAYMMITFSTNVVPGEGSSTDQLFIDDIEMIYVTKLANVKVNGTNIPNFDPNNANYDYYFCFSELPLSLTGTTASTLASANTSIVSDGNDGFTGTITVTNGPDSKVYHINFIPIDDNNFISTASQSVCGSGSANYAINTGNNSNITASWYNAATGGTPIYSGISFSTPVLSATTSYWAEISNSICSLNRIEVVTSVYPQYLNHELTDTACSSYLIGSNNYTASGDYTVSFHTINGCDSIINLHLTINQPKETIFEDTVCYNSPYNKFGFNLPNQLNAGNNQHFKYLQTSKSCDSTVILNLFVKTPRSRVINLNMCSYELPYYLYGQPYNEGNYEIFVENNNDCDSLIHLNVTSLASYLTTLPTVTICNDATYNFYGETLTESGNYQKVFQSVLGCDSIIALQLVISDFYETILPPYSICNGSTYDFNGKTISQTGHYVDTLVAANGCDSLVVLNLTVNYSSNSDIYASICQGNYYTQNGFNENLQGEYYRSISNHFGCDSVITLHLTVNQPSPATNINASICQGETYYENGFNESSTGTYTHNLVNINNCDSTVILHLTVKNNSSHSFSDHICKGNAYNSNGFSLPVQNSTGTFSHQLLLTNSVECDSNILLYLTVYPTYTSFSNLHSCNLIQFEDSIYTESTVVIRNISTATGGCDSIITTTITIVQSSPDTHISDYICQGETYIQNGFNISQQNIVGTFEFSKTFLNSNFCDSIVYLSLFVAPKYLRTITDTIYVGEHGGTYNENGFSVFAPTPNIYRDTLHLSSTFGCDSTVMLLLYAFPGAGINAIQNNSISIYPNPANNIITLLSNELIKEVAVINVQGNLQKIEKINAGNKVIISLENFSPGIYFIKTTTNLSIYMNKIIKQ